MASYGLAQIPAGYLSDRLGPRRLVFAGLLGWSVLVLGFGLARAFWLAAAILLVGGVFRALLFAPGLALLASWFPAQRRATAMSLFLFGGASGSVVLALAGPLLAELHGWRATLVLFAALAAGIACLFAAFAKDRPRRKERKPPSIRDFLAIVRFPILWVCSWLQFVRFAVVMGFHFWLPYFLVADRGFSLQATGAVMAMSAALSAPSNTLGAYVSDRLRNPPLVIGGALAALACAAALLPTVEFVCVYALGAVRDASGSFAWGFLGIGAACLAGVALSFLLARLRNRALRASGRPRAGGSIQINRHRSRRA
jgi:sugar phosphate permease